MGRNVKTKAKLERQFMKRWSYRYPDVRMPPIDWIVDQIRSGGGAVQSAGRQSLVRSQWVLDVNGVRVPIIYDTKRGTVVTALPSDVIAEFERQ